jgi:hypothetical protein
MNGNSRYNSLIYKAKIFYTNSGFWNLKRERRIFQKIVMESPKKGELEGISVRKLSHEFFGYF